VTDSVIRQDHQWKDPHKLVASFHLNQFKKIFFHQLKLFKAGFRVWPSMLIVFLVSLYIKKSENRKNLLPNYDSYPLTTPFSLSRVILGVTLQNILLQFYGKMAPDQSSFWS
jgi:hypothetical protein